MKGEGAFGHLKLAEDVPARFMGFHDRGEIAVGRKADINLIDTQAMELHSPRAVCDLPAGGRHLEQTASGYRCTIVGGRIIQRDGVPTDERPGRLIRGTSGNKAPAWAVTAETVA